MPPFPTSSTRSRRRITAAVGACFLTAAALADPTSPIAMAPVTVTGTRERALLAETPSSIGAISADSIHDSAPLHPGQLLGQVPGVAVAVTNGEGHTTAIRQPFTTSPVYLFLEDGIPIRATGFFNHNVLYEVDIPAAGGIEVVRGPGTALYGSDAIGGIVNVLSRAPLGQPHAQLRTEYGSFGTWRVLGDAGGALGEGAIRLDANVTHTDGWRDRTAYDRQAANVRFDRPLGPDRTVKTVVAYSHVDQQTGANSALPFADYLNNPTRNNLAIAFRKVRAVRASIEYEQRRGADMVSIIPYFRDNAMELNGTYNLNSDPRIETTHNVSYGLLAKFRRNIPVMRTRLIGGLDLDCSPGSRREDNLLVTRSGTGADTVFTAYTIGTRIYDYAVTFKSASPYLHAEFSPSPALRLTAGLRYDALRYAMKNHLPAGAVAANVLGTTRYYGQIARHRTSFSRLNPKLGATYAITPETSAYTSYNFGFRAPSESQLYRAGHETTAANAATRANLALGLRPIRADQVEFGVRGRWRGWSYDVAAYELRKRDDLVSRRDVATNVSTNTNAGETEHRGVELGLGGPIGDSLRLDAALSYARHRYVSWVTANANFSGRHIEAAPNMLANTRLTWRHGRRAMVQLEWVRIGSYWLDAGNSDRFGRYPGHDLLNVRANWMVAKQLSLFARVMNATDRRFAESASVTSNTAVFSPGLPRAVHGGVELDW